MSESARLFQECREELCKPLLPANVNMMGMASSFSQNAAPLTADAEPVTASIAAPSSPAISIMDNIEAPKQSFEAMAPRINEGGMQTAARHLSNTMGEFMNVFGKSIGMEQPDGPAADAPSFDPRQQPRAFIPQIQPSPPRGMM